MFIEQGTNYVIEGCPFVFVKDDYAVIGSSAGTVTLDFKNPVYVLDPPFSPGQPIDPTTVKIDLHIETEESTATVLNIEHYEKLKKIVSQFFETATRIMKTSEEWSKLYTHKILDPDGWDRKNFYYSWYKERISREEFEQRAMKSILEMKTWMDKE